MDQIYQLPCPFVEVTLNMDTGVNLLGISIEGRCRSRIDKHYWGVIVKGIMIGSPVALDGRIKPGDMILHVNEISFDNMSKDDIADIVKVQEDFKDAIQKPGLNRLVVAKSKNPAYRELNYYKGPFTNYVNMFHD